MTAAINRVLLTVEGKDSQSHLGQYLYRMISHICSKQVLSHETGCYLLES